MTLTLESLTLRHRSVSKPADAGRQSVVRSEAFHEPTRMRLHGRGFVPALIHARLLPLTGRFRVAKRSLLLECSGSSLIETAVIVPVLVLLLVGAVDYGRGFYTAIEVSSAAESAAVYGTSNPTDAVGIAAMAKLDAKDISNLTVNAAYGCECADGTGAVVSCISSVVCSNNAVRYVDVWTSAVYTPLLPYPAIQSSFTLTGHSRMRMSSN